MPALGAGHSLFCGERGIRTPGPVTVNGFQDRRIRPLCHLSGAKIGVEGFPKKLSERITYFFIIHFEYDN